MGKKNKYGDGNLSPEEAMAWVNAVVDGEADASSLSQISEPDGDELFGLEEAIFGKKEEKHQKSFREKATKQPKNHKPIMNFENQKSEKESDPFIVRGKPVNVIKKVDIEFKPDSEEEDNSEPVLDDNGATEIPYMSIDTSGQEMVNDDEWNTEDNNDIRHFIVTPISAFGRAIIQDGVSAYPFDLSASSEESFDIDMEKYRTPESRDEIENIVDVLRQYIISRSFPAAIYTKEEFDDEFSSVESYDEDKFIFFEEDGYVYAYVINDDAWTNFEEVISTGFVKGQDLQNLETFLRSYISLTILINNPHVGFYQGSDDFIEVYMDDGDINMKEDFSELLYNDEDTLIREAPTSGIKAVHIESFSQMAANIVAILIGEDEDDDEDDEIEDIKKMSVDELIDEMKGENNEQGNKDDGQDLSQDRGRDNNNLDKGDRGDRRLESDRGKEAEEKVEEADKTASSESLEESEEGDSEGVSVDDLFDDTEAEMVDVPKGIDVLGSSDDDENIIPVVRKR